jgi:hypothetical protein
MNAAARLLFGIKPRVSAMRDCLNLRRMDLSEAIRIYGRRSVRCELSRLFTVNCIQPKLYQVNSATRQSLRRRGSSFKAARDYPRQVAAIEERRADDYGHETIARLRQGLAAMFVRSGSGVAPLMAALTPPPGTARAGELAPSLVAEIPAPPRGNAFEPWSLRPKPSCTIPTHYRTILCGT